MLTWAAFAAASPELARAGIRLFAQNELAFLATVSRSGRPRVHPFVPRIVDAQLLAFIKDTSPKLQDLQQRGHYSIHAMPGAQDEEFSISGDAHRIDKQPELRTTAAAAMGFFTGIDAHHILFEFRINSALWTIWLDFGTPAHRAQRQRWRAA